MQRYEDFVLIPRNLPISDFVCCDNDSELRQNDVIDVKSVACIPDETENGGWYCRRKQPPLSDDG